MPHDEFQVLAEAVVNWQKGTLDSVSAKFLLRLERESNHPDQAFVKALEHTWDTCPAAYLVGRANHVAVVVSKGPNTEAEAGRVGNCVNGVNLAAREVGDKLKATTVPSSVWSRVSNWNRSNQAGGLMNSQFGLETLFMDS